MDRQASHSAETTRSAPGAGSVSTERTNTLLRQALFSLLMAKPFEKISLTDICKLAMIPRSTFYRHFEDKYALLDHCFDQIMLDAQLTADVRMIRSRETARTFFQALFRYLEKHRATYRKMIASNRQTVLTACLHGYLERQIRKSIADACTAADGGTQTAEPPPSADLFAHVLASIIFSAGESYINSETACDADDLAERLSLFADETF